MNEIPIPEDKNSKKQDLLEVQVFCATELFKAIDTEDGANAALNEMLGMELALKGVKPRDKRNLIIDALDEAQKLDFVTRLNSEILSILGRLNLGVELSFALKGEILRMFLNNAHYGAIEKLEKAALVIAEKASDSAEARVQAARFILEEEMKILFWVILESKMFPRDVMRDQVFDAMELLDDIDHGEDDATAKLNELLNTNVDLKGLSREMIRDVLIGNLSPEDRHELDCNEFWNETVDEQIEHVVRMILEAKAEAIEVVQSGTREQIEKVR